MTVIRYGFGQLGLHRIHANQLACNPASGRVLQKVGMRYEGCMVHHVRHRGTFEDLALYATSADRTVVTVAAPGAR